MLRISHFIDIFFRSLLISLFQLTNNDIVKRIVNRYYFHSSMFDSQYNRFEMNEGVNYTLRRLYSRGHEMEYAKQYGLNA